MKFLLPKIVLISFFLFIPFFTSHVYAWTPCAQITTDPRFSTGPFYANQSFKITGSGCTAENGKLNVVWGPVEGDNTTGGVEVTVSSNGTFEATIGDIVDSSIIQFPVTYQIAVADSRAMLANDKPGYEPNGPFQIVFSARRAIQCNDIVSNADFNKCPGNCPARADPDNPSVNRCLPVPTAVAKKSCTVTANVFKDQNTFTIAATVETSRLTPGTYRLILQNGFIPSSQGFTVTSGQTSSPITFSNLDSGYNGKTLDLFAEDDCGWFNGDCPHIDNCSTKVTFDDVVAPTIGPETTLFPTPEDPGTGSSNPFTFQVCSVSGNTLHVPGEKSTGVLDSADVGIMTAFGCLPTDAGKLVTTIIGWAIGLAGGIAFLLILFGGITIITSAGNPERMNQGKEIITSAIVGLLLIILSVFILKILGVDLIGIPGFS